MKNCVNEIGKRCCGCRSCEYVCPKKAISFQQNEEGFLYPVVNSDCVECGKCIEQCPVLNPPKKHIPNCGYSGYIKDKSMLINSSSGGAFVAIAEAVLSMGGVVFGCSEEKAGYPHHIKIDDINKLFLLQGSKYVESEMECSVYDDIKKELSHQRKVLFSGTPCQCASVKKIFGENENLYLVDIICHGVPSRALYEDYLNWIEDKYNAQVLKFNFRSKQKHGWSLTYKLDLKKRNTTISRERIATVSPYYRHFLASLDYRESCYICEFACFDRVTDITIGDFWGIEKIDWNMFNYDGVSAILVNSIQGRELWKYVTEKMVTNEVAPEMIAQFNGQLNHPSQRPLIRDSYYNDWINNGYGYIDRKYRDNRALVMDSVRDLIPNKIRMDIKKLLK